MTTRTESRSFIRYARQLPAVAVLGLLSGCCGLGTQNWFTGRPPVTDDQTVRRTPAPPDNGDPASPPKKSQGAPTTAVTLNVTAPSRMQRGSQATFIATITNKGNAAAEGLELESRLDKGLEFPGSKDRAVHRPIASLEAGKSRTVSLTLQCRETGKHCAEFALKTNGRELVWKSVCLEVVEPVYGVKLILPKQRTVGSRVEPTVMLANNSQQPLKNVRLVLNYDATVFKPQTVGRRATATNGRLTWDIGNLKPGEGVPVQAEFGCLIKSDRACFSTEVTVDDGPTDARYACLEVVDPPETFDMRLSDTRDLLRTGDETEFIVGVLNRTSAKATGPVLAVDVPENFRIVSAEVWSGAFKLMTKSTVKDGRVTFESPGVVAVNSETTYRIRVKAMRPGQAEFQGDLQIEEKSLLKLGESITVLPR